MTRDLHSDRDSSRSPWPLPVSSVVAFAVPAIVVLYYSLRGGSYDIVPRQEEAIVVWGLLALGFAFGLLPRSRPARVAAIPFAAICLLALWTALQLSWTQSDERTFAELARYLHYTGLLLLIWSVVDVRNWRAAAAGLVFAALAVVVLAVASRLDPGAFPTNYVNRSLNVDRLSYPFNYWNAVGAWAVMALSAALVISAHARQLVLRAVTLALVPVCGAAIYLSYSRAAFIGAALAFLLVLVFSHNRWVALAHEAAAAVGSVLVVLVIHNKPQIANATGNAGAGAVVLALVGAAVICAAAAALTWHARGDARWRLPRRTARIGLAAAVVLVLVAVPAAGHSAISKGWHQFRHEPNHPVSADPTARLANLNGTRYFIWRGAVRAFDHKPIKGLGSGTFEFWWNYNGGNEFVRDAHSIYLESFAEGGLPGGLLTLTLLAGLAVGGILTRRRLTGPDRALQSALVVAFLVYLFHAGVDWMWESTAVSVLGLSMAAVGIAAVSSPLERRASLVRVRLPIAAAAVIVALLQLPGLVSTTSTRASQRLFNRGELTAALGKASDAIHAEPWASTPYVQRALVEEAMRRLGAARVDLDRAIAREPTNYRPPLLLSRVDAEAGDVKAALDAYRRAKALRPDSIFFAPQ